MANKIATSTGGKKLAQEVFDFMQANIEAMKKDGANRDAVKNEEQGIKDMANAIAFAVEKVMGGPFVPLAAPKDIVLTTLVVGAPVPALGTIQMNIVNPTYPF